ncbi:hypothetical protein V8E52_008075 [Russula decolorans]
MWEQHHDFASPGLHKILELLLVYLVSLSQPHNAASVLELSRSLEFEHEVRREFTLQVMHWFGHVDDADERWEMDVEKVVRQVGLGILRQYYKSEPISEDEFMTKWNTAVRVGDTFISNTSLNLLTGNYLCAPSPSTSSITLTSYFPCVELPTDLFLTGECWKAEYIKLYLSDIAVDTKDFDKLLLKHARALTDKDGSWYTARAR